MSDSSSLSTQLPDDTQLEQSLRVVVQKLYSSGDLEQLTVKRVRAAAEKDLDLPTGFYKDAAWKVRSKTIIEREASRHAEAGSAVVEKPRPPSMSPPKRKSNKRVIEDEDEDLPTVKRRSKAKRIISDEEEEEQEEDDLSSPRTKKAPKTKGPASGPKPNVKVSSSKYKDETIIPSIEHDSDIEVPAAAFAESKKRIEEDMGESDLSELLDEAPQAKRKKKESASVKSKAEPKKRSKPAVKSRDLDPQAEEIKSLQGWLVKCGVRKVWGKELKPYETPREKIKHLKGMLTDIGMTGRFSKEKAESIREARELAADLEAVQAGAKLWGMEDGSNPKETRRAARSAQPTFDFIEYDSED